MKQLIFDIETLGNDSTCICLCASFLVYDLVEDAKTPMSELEKRVKTFKISVEDQREQYKRTVSDDTVKWWKEQMVIAPELKSILARSPDDLTMLQFYQKLTAWLREQGYNKREGWAWQRGTLDIMVLDSMFKQLDVKGRDYPILWYKIRDLRTAIDLCGDTELNGYIKGIKEDAPNHIPGFTKHNPDHDVLLEVLQLRLCGIFGE